MADSTGIHEALADREAEQIDLDPARVNRLLKALAYKTRDLHQYDAAADDERGELAMRHDTESAELEDRIQRDRAGLVETVGVLERELELIGRARISEDPGAGTWKLPAGRIAVAGGGIEKLWDDDAALLAWCETHCPEAIEPQPPKLLKNVLWEHLKDKAVKEEHKRQAPVNADGTVVVDGELVPGLRVVAKERTVTPTPNLDAATGEA